MFQGGDSTPGPQKDPIEPTIHGNSLIQDAKNDVERNELLMERYASTLIDLKSKGVSHVLKINGLSKYVRLSRETKPTHEILSKFDLYDYKNNVILKDFDIHAPNTIPFGLWSHLCLLTGDNPNVNAFIWLVSTYAEVPRILSDIDDKNDVMSIMQGPLKQFSNDNPVKYRLLVQLNESTKLCKPRGDAFKKFVEHFVFLVKVNYTDYCRKIREQEAVNTLNAVAAMSIVNNESNTPSSEEMADADF